MKAPNQPTPLEDREFSIDPFVSSTRLIKFTNALLCSMILLLVAAFAGGCGQKKHGGYDTTKYYLRQNVIAIKLCENNSGKPILELISANKEAKNLWEAVRGIYLANTNVLFLQADQIETKLLRDAWGTAINIAYSTNMPRSATFPTGALNEYGIVIWSSGANQSNQFGGGDDIIWEMSWR